MDTDTVWQAIDEQRAALADLLDGLPDDAWRVPSLCDGWTVQDVAAHLTLAHTGAPRAVTDLVRARGGFDRMIRETAVRQAARVPRQDLAPRIRAMVGSRRKAAFVSDLEPLIDVLVHGQDIARPLGLPHPVPPAPAAAAATRVWTMGFPFMARKRLRGLRLVAEDAEWTAGEGERVEGPMGAILLVLTGRPAGLVDLSGPGLRRLPGAGPNR